MTNPLTLDTAGNVKINAKGDVSIAGMQDLTIDEIIADGDVVQKDNTRVEVKELEIEAKPDERKRFADYGDSDERDSAVSFS